MLYPEDHPFFFSVLTGFNLSERHPWFNEFVFWAANLATASTRLKLLPEVEAGDGVPLVYWLGTVVVQSDIFFQIAFPRWKEIISAYL